MFERATPDFVPSDASRLAGLATFEMLATRVADWRPDFINPAADAHLAWATMHGLISIELMHRRWGGPSSRTSKAIPSRTTQPPSAHTSKPSTAASRFAALHDGLGACRHVPFVSPRFSKRPCRAKPQSGSAWRRFESLLWHYGARQIRPLTRQRGRLRRAHHSAQSRSVGNATAA